MEDHTADELLEALGANHQLAVLAAVLGVVLQTDAGEALRAGANGLIGGELQRAERLGLVVSSLVLTGGTSQLPGIAQLAHRELNMPCRVACPCYPQGLSDALASPIFSGSIGLLLHGAARRFLPQDKGEVKSSKFRQVVHSVSRWLAEVF